MFTFSKADLRAAWVSTYPPRECGIGTFTRDLAQAAATLPRPVEAVIAAINGPGERYDYGPEVRLQLDEGDPASYVAAARRLSAMREIDVVSIQHDFGKFGRWRDGFEADYLVPMLDALAQPAVVTLHSVTPQPAALVRRTVQALAERAAAVVVMANIAKVLLQEDYGVDDAALAKVVQIPHGVPAGLDAGLPPAVAKRALGLEGRCVLSTFGLLGEGKGIEYMLDALPPLVARYPDLLYLVLGQTHPEVRRLRGEGYRGELVAHCRALGIERHVQFVNRYLPQAELLAYLAATDVYVTPYLARSQITSGTLAYALGCGKAIVSTPYLYAAEALAEGRGVFAEFRSAASLAGALASLLDNPAFRQATAARAGAYGRAMAWPAVAARYRALFCQAAGRPADQPVTTGLTPLPAEPALVAPAAAKAAVEPSAPAWASAASFDADAADEPEAAAAGAGR